MHPKIRTERVQTPSKRLQARLGMLVLALLFALPSTGLAQDAEGTLKYRQDLMSAIGSDMAAISDILKFRLPLQANIETHASNIASNAGLMNSAFKAPISDGPTDAKPEIWQDWAHFEKDIAKMKAAAEKLSQTVAQGGDGAAIGAGLKTLGRTCGGCHKEFRKSKKESYKNK